MGTKRKTKNITTKEQKITQSNMIKSVTIDNFRQFDSLEVNNLKRINFFVGKNNCGKTSVVEALFWGLSPWRIESIGSIHSFRRMTLTIESFATLFKNQDETKTIVISIRTIHDQKQTIKVFQNIDESYQYPINKSYQYQVSYKDSRESDEEEYTGNLSISLVPQARLHLQLNNIQNPELLPSILLTGAFISDYIGKELMVHQLNSIKKSLEKNQQVKECLQYFDHDIQSIEFGSNNSVNISTKEDILPIEIMGDGFNKYLRIVVGLINKGLNILFIDEIENGLHHITQIKLLKIILRLSKQKNIQLFITTHSLETLTFLSQIMQEEEFCNQKDDVQVISLTNTELAGFQTYNYNMETVIDYIETESELRD